MRSILKQTLPALALLVAVALPAVLSDFHVFLTTQILIYAIAILGLNLLTGYNGQISLGHGAFFAIGAFAVGIMVGSFGVPYYLALPAAGLISFVLGYLFGLPALRLEGHYLALATFALALAVPQILKLHVFEPWTGGVQGIYIDKPQAPVAFLNDDQWLYYLTLAVTVAMFVAAANLLRGRVGRAITAIRDQPVAANALGVNISQYKATVFGISALYTGLAGGLGAIVIQFVAPEGFTMFLSIFLLVGLVVGGIGSLPGAFIGAAFIVITPNLATDISKAAPGVVYGVALIGFIYLLPKGAWGGLTALARRLAPGGR